MSDSKSGSLKQGKGTHGQTVTEPNSSSHPGQDSWTGAHAHPASIPNLFADRVRHIFPQETTFDYVIVGGGTAGSVLANRLTEDPNVSVAVIEGGPSDVNLERVLNLRKWIKLLDSDLDYVYPTVEQPNGNSHILHSRARVLGGCSSHNTLISFRPFKEDLDDWARAGAKGWDADTMQPYGDRIKLNTVPVLEKDRNPTAKAWVQSCSQVTGAPVVDDFNAQIVHRGGFPDGNAVGFFSISYDPYNNYRSSASVAYLHPIMGLRKNLHFFLESWTHGLVFDDKDPKKVVGVRFRTKRGVEKTVTARKEVLLCAGAIDSPRLLLHAGVGSKEDFEKLGIPVRHDLPGVGENLLDHPESIIMWRTTSSPKESVMDSDAGLFHRLDKSDPRPDLMWHIYQIPFADNTQRLGYPRPEHAICMTPNIARPKSKGKLSLASSDPSDKPLLDFRYFTDPEGYDERILIEGIKIARKIAQTSPWKEHLLEEVAPGPKVQTDEEIGEYARRAAHTVYHPAGTCKIGADDDPLAVLDERLRVRGLKGIRVVDASVFPVMTTVNPMLTVLTVAERAADLIRQDALAADAERAPKAKL